MKLLFATGNKFKYELMKERLKELTDIDLINPKMLNINLDVLEDCKTAEENSIKKAVAYYNATKLPTIAEDSGLHIDKFKLEEQPGLFVKRINGVEGLSDEEILNYYLAKLSEYGGESLANYYTGVCIVDNFGNTFSDTIDETKFLLTTKKYESDILSGGVLECISYDINANKYFEQRNEEETKKHYAKLDERYREMVKQYVLKK